MGMKELVEQLRGKAAEIRREQTACHAKLREVSSQGYSWLTYEKAHEAVIMGERAAVYEEVASAIEAQEANQLTDAQVRLLERAASYSDGLAWACTLDEQEAVESIIYWRLGEPREGSCNGFTITQAGRDALAKAKGESDE